MTALYAEGVAWVLTALLGRWTPVAREDALEPRLHQLLTTRRGVVLAIDDERRRIERDLHDGVQQNVVSLSVTLARARRAEDPQRSAQLLGQAHSQSQALIEEVRQVAWRVYPTALDEHGLASALEGVAGTSPVPVDLVTEVEETLPPAVESAAYFVVREAVTNVVKHAGATGARVEVRTDAARGRRLLRLAVRDDGVGGADPEGGGLQGLARRVAALDGSLDVDSPPGGPTVITAEIPCD
jgi:signal transduction histidine kinase